MMLSRWRRPTSWLVAAAATLTPLAAVSSGPLSAQPAAAAAAVNVFPLPGDPVAPPGSQISFRGISASQIGSVSVTGSASGAHTGHIVAHSDGNGGSFLPDHPFRAGETVTVNTALSVVGGRGGLFTFKVATPASGPPALRLPPTPRVRGDVYHFVSRRDLAPPTVRLTGRPGRTAAGDLFLAPQNGPLQLGPMVLNPFAGLIWFKAAPRGQTATDVRVQSYHGNPVLTWWQGRLSALGTGNGTDMINDTAYHVVGTVRGGNGIPSDLHEFQLTPQNTALITGYEPLRWPRGRGTEVVLNSVVQEIDIPTGLVLFQWDSLDQVPVSDSYQSRPPAKAHLPYDYFHVNSAHLTPDGNFIISARNAWGVYEISRHDGSMIWRLGGKHSSFTMGRDTRFAFQHDAQLNSSGVVTVFDDGAGPPVERKHSRALALSLDLVHHTATVARSTEHRPGLLSFFEGNVQQLSNGDEFVGWGQQPYLTEFDSSGRTVFDARFVGANSSYRAYRFAWTGAPLTLPAIATRRSRGKARVYMSWNGDTRATSWRVLGGGSATALKSVAQVARRTFESNAALPASARYVAVQALASGGTVLATSKTIKVR